MPAKTALMKVRDIAWRHDDPMVRNDALSILTAGATIVDVERDPDGMRRVMILLDAGCSDEYAYYDEHGPVVTTARGWYHVVTCPGAKPCYAPGDWWPEEGEEDVLH